LPCSLPGLGFIKLFLVHCAVGLSSWIPSAHLSSVSYAGATKKSRPSRVQLFTISLYHYNVCHSMPCFTALLFRALGQRDGTNSVFPYKPLNKAIILYIYTVIRLVLTFFIICCPSVPLSQ
jgi:hypothetical protein